MWFQNKEAHALCDVIFQTVSLGGLKDVVIKAWASLLQLNKANMFSILIF